MGKVSKGKSDAKRIRQAHSAHIFSSAQTEYTTFYFMQQKVFKIEIMMTAQYLKTLTIRHSDFTKLQGMPASQSQFLRLRQIMDNCQSG
jgi:hypothetical protein